MSYILWARESGRDHCTGEHDARLEYHLPRPVLPCAAATATAIVTTPRHQTTASVTACFAQGPEHPRDNDDIMGALLSWGGWISSHASHHTQVRRPLGVRPGTTGGQQPARGQLARRWVAVQPCFCSSLCVGTPGTIVQFKHTRARARTLTHTMPCTHAHIPASVKLLLIYRRCTSAPSWLLLLCRASSQACSQALTRRQVCCLVRGGQHLDAGQSVRRCARGYAPAYVVWTMPRRQHQRQLQSTRLVQRRPQQ